MDLYEVGELVDCALCGCDVSLGRDCAYAMVESALCFSCAVCRGGVYDEAKRTWLRSPDVGGLDRAAASQRSRKRYWRDPTLRTVFASAHVDAGE